MLGVSSGFYYGGGQQTGVDSSGGGGGGGGEGGRGGEEATGFQVGVGEFQKIQSVLVDGGDRYGVSAVAFDRHEELIWMGNRGGHVTSYYGTNMEKYTSFQVTANQEVRQILTFDDLILILSESQLRGQIRRGLPVFTHTSDNLMNMQCMLPTSMSTVLLGGHQDTIVEYDFNQNTETKVVALGGTGCAILRGQPHIPHRICAGLTSGHVFLLDSRTYKKEHTIEAHSGSLSDLDVHGNMLVTCGFSNRHGACSVDHFLKLYDLRALRALAPIQVSVDPIMLRFLPSFSSRIAIVSPTGQMEILETQALSSSNIMIYQVTSNGSESRAFDVSNSCHHLAFGDEAGTLNLFTSNPTVTFNPFPRATEFPDPVPDHFPSISFDDEGPGSCIASIPIPLLSINDPLTSDWPSHLTHPGYRRVPEISAQILQSMKMVGPIGYAPNPGNLRRNQMQYNKFDMKNNGGHLEGNLNLSKVSLSPSPTSMVRESQQVKQFSPPGAIAHSPIPIIGGPMRIATRPLGPAGILIPRGMHHARHPHSNHPHHPNKFHIPKRYARTEWKKPGWELTDLEAFNKTKFPGLEAITANSYCNSMIQVLYHIEYLRGFLVSHLCTRESCLSCELGFLFSMLDRTQTVPCVDSNFLRALRVIPEASALGLIRQENQAKERSTYNRLVMNFNRFILHQIETETKDKGENSTSKDVNAVDELFAMRQEYVNKCTRCAHFVQKESTVLLSNLIHAVPVDESGRAKCSFVDLLQKSLYPQQTTAAWCEHCKKYSTTYQTRAPKNLPNILSINACLDASSNMKDFETWRLHMESLLPVKEKDSIDSTTAMDNNSPPSAVQTIGPGHAKICRYGTVCARPDCKFWHEGRNAFGGNGAVARSEYEMNAEMTAKWLPLRMWVSIDEETGQVSVTDMDGKADGNSDHKKRPLSSEYELFSTVAYVRDPELEEKHNLASVIRVPKRHYLRSGQPLSSTGGWVLFNDFCVKEVSCLEATHFNPIWKIPSVIYYQKVELPEELKYFPITTTVTEDAFLKEMLMSKPKIRDNSGGKGVGKSVIPSGRPPVPLPYRPLNSEEMPKKGDLVAMDAEFVTLSQEESELRSDGKLATIKPQQLSLARVTCLRGQGSLEGQAFLDDYISTQEVVVDYLTKFSGILPGDLDVNYSSKHLTTLKSVYLKLRFLIDSGVKFVGHGLYNDFRVINLVVPSNQVVDTVNLFHLPNQRMVSLRFLAWHFLGEVIQSDTHDSAEDARAALALYRKYEELKASGRLEKALEDLYDLGSKLQWKVNGSDK